MLGLYRMNPPSPISHFPSMFEEGKLNEKQEQESNCLHTDLLAFHEQNAGRLIVDPECVFFFVTEC